MAELDLTEQDLLQDALARRVSPLDPLERRAEFVVGGAFLLAVLALGAWANGSGAWDPVLAIASALGLVVAMKVRFDVAGIYTVPAQLAFVPMLFAVPAQALPVVVVLCMAASQLPDVLRGAVPPSRMLLSVANGWFTIGPAAVLLAVGGPGALVDDPILMVSIFAAQLLTDFTASAVREWLVRGAPLRDQLSDARWVYGVDAALTPLAYVAVAPVGGAWQPLALCPLLLLLASFARERRERLEGAFELTRAYRGMALVLGDVVEADDQYTGEHCRDVVDLAMGVGRALGLEGNRLRDLEFGALLHDVGKVAIPKEIINKPDRLTPEEYEIVKAHAAIGQQMLCRVGGFMRDVGRIVRHHHERWDGAGYPDRLIGEDIPLEARIVACCDTFNAITTTRPYRKGRPASVAVDELRRCSGTQFDPMVVDALVALVQEQLTREVLDRTAVLTESRHSPTATAGQAVIVSVRSEAPAVEANAAPAPR